MLRLKQAQLHQSITEEQARLDRVRARLRQIEREGELPANEVIVRDIPELRVLRCREILSHTSEIKTFFERIRRATGTNPIQTTGPWIALYWEGEYKTRDIDVEGAIPISEDGPQSLQLDDERYMQVGILPPVKVASTLCHMVSDADVRLANRHLCAWIENNGYAISDGPGREVYAVAHQHDKTLIFEIQLPIEKHM